MNPLFLGEPMNIKYGRIMRVNNWEKASLLAEQGWKLVTVRTNGFTYNMLKLAVDFPSTARFNSDSNRTLAYAALLAVALVAVLVMFGREDER